MKVLHVTPHLGGGIGTVLMDWMDKVYGEHEIVVLDNQIKEMRGRRWVTFNSGTHPVLIAGATMDYNERVSSLIHHADIVLVHYWDHPMLADLFAVPLPDCRMVWWCHKNIKYSQRELDYPDLWIDTSPIQLNGRYIWSTGDISRFLNLQPKPHNGFNVGYIGTVDFKKLHPNFFDMCNEIDKNIPNVHFIVVGENNIGGHNGSLFTFIGKVDDVAPYLAEMDIFSYPLRPDHYGTSEQVLGEAMAAGIVLVVMGNPCEMLIVKHGGNGFVATTEADYVAHIQYLYNHPIRRRALSNAATIDAKKLYSIDTMIQKWNDVFEEMMEKPKTSRKPL
jgi:glycosyltransferase involved in cell wall biosynthesis